MSAWLSKMKKFFLAATIMVAIVWVAFFVTPTPAFAQDLYPNRLGYECWDAEDADYDKNGIFCYKGYKACVAFGDRSEEQSCSWWGQSLPVAVIDSRLASGQFLEPCSRPNAVWFGLKCKTQSNQKESVPAPQQMAQPAPTQKIEPRVSLNVPEKPEVIFWYDGSEKLDLPCEKQGEVWQVEGMTLTCGGPKAMLPKVNMPLSFGSIAGILIAGGIAVRLLFAMFVPRRIETKAPFIGADGLPGMMKVTQDGVGWAYRAGKRFLFGPMGGGSWGFMPPGDAGPAWDSFMQGVMTLLIGIVVIVVLITLGLWAFGVI